MGSDYVAAGRRGILAGCCGVAGAVVGMSEVWYTGPLGKLAGAEFGADLGFEVSARALNRHSDSMFNVFHSSTARSGVRCSDVPSIAVPRDPAHGTIGGEAVRY